MAGAMYNLGVRFKAVNGVSPTIKTIEYDTKKATGAMFAYGTSIQRTLKGMRLKGIFGGGRYAMLGAAAGLYAIGNGFKHIVSQTAQFESARTKLDTLMGSVEEGGQMMQRFARLAGNTPLEFADVMGGGTSLRLAIKDQETLMKRAKQLGDMAVGDPERFANLTDAYIMAAQASVGGGGIEKRILKRFITAKVPLFEALQSVTGEKDLMSAIRKGKIGIDDVNASIDLMTAKGGLFHDSMKKQMRTLVGQASNFKDVWNIASASIGSRFNEEMKNVILQSKNKMLDLMDLIMAPGSDFGAGIATTLQKVAEIIANLDVEKLVTGLRKIVGAITWLVKGFIMLKVAITVLNIIATVAAVAGSVMIAVGSGLTIAWFPIIAIVLAVAAGIWAVVAASRAMAGLPSIGSFGEMFDTINARGIDPSALPTSDGGRARVDSVQREINNQTASLNVNLGQGLTGEADGDYDFLRVDNAPTGDTRYA